MSVFGGYLRYHQLSVTASSLGFLGRANRLRPQTPSRQARRLQKSGDRAPTKRNQQRLAQANESDVTILGEFPAYLPNSISDYLPRPVTGPDDSCTPPSIVFGSVDKVYQLPMCVPEKPSVHFSSSPQAVQVNSELLAKYDFDLERLLDSESGTTVEYGSEFRPLS